MYRLLSSEVHCGRGKAILCLALLTLTPISQRAGRAVDEVPTYTDVAAAGKDYKIQGEYTGQVGDNNWGAQVIALGEGKFKCIGYPGGLPGDGYQPGAPKRESEGGWQSDLVKLKGENYELQITDGRLKVLTQDGELIGTLVQVKRESPTLGQKPPAGAIVLFDGTSADRFENGVLTADKYLQADTTSKEKFGEHQLHVEFRTPFRPLARGQERGNSGVYIQSRFELQVLDSFGLSGENNECGGIYSIAKPSVNMCYPPLTWQTYDIDFTSAKYDAAGKKTSNARVTIRHNGVVIHKDLELKQGTPGNLPEGESEEGVYLQGHGNPVVYRNIWAVKR
jgi:Domain of Unknown Function (DUF1080)